MTQKNEVVVTKDQPPAIGGSPGELLSAIVMLSKDASVDVAKLDALLKMQERMEARQAEIEFGRALSRLASKMPRVKKNGTVELGQGKGSYKFTRWEDMDKIIRPLMTDEGFTLSFSSGPRPGDGGGAVITGVLLHADGHSLSASISLPLDSGPGRNNLQAMGSTLSYGKRYCAEMLLNIVREGDDDDGKAGGTVYLGQGQCEEVRKLLKQSHASEDAFCDYMGVRSVEEIETKNYATAINALNIKIKKMTQEQAS